jgi:hypothetical protein
MSDEIEDIDIDYNDVEYWALNLAENSDLKKLRYLLSYLSRKKQDDFED